jgi:hypothetical protein
MVNASARFLAADVFAGNDRRDHPDQRPIRAIQPYCIGDHVNLRHVFICHAAPVRLVPVDYKLPGFAVGNDVFAHPVRLAVHIDQIDVFDDSKTQPAPGRQCFGEWMVWPVLWVGK